MYYEQMNYEKIRENPNQFIILTSLTVDEFDVLLAVFKRHWLKYNKYHTLEGKKRKLPNLKPDKPTKTLPSVAEKLFFLLSYLKNYPLQQFQAASFGISQAKVSQWVKVLHPLLQDSLDELGALPERQAEAVVSVLAKYDGEAFSMDATERSVERSQDDDNQQDHYSGKQQDHTVKNNLMCRDNQQIVYLSETYEGRVHDKKIADEEACRFPKDSRLKLDLGYLGYQPEGVLTLMPIKKPYQSELTRQEKKFNHWASSLRVVVEHAISGVKRCRIAKERCRNFAARFRDQVMLTCTGLHNLRVSSPQRGYR